MRKKIGSVLVVGAGISGIRSALDMAQLGYRVTLIDKSPNLGGTLAQLDYQFPSDGCGMCKMLPLLERDHSSQYCLRKGLFHENIELLLNTEMTALEGEPGKFLATLSKRANPVDPEHCIGCGECSQVCPMEVPDEFNAGLGNRKVIYLPTPQCLPNQYIMDFDSGRLCGQCEAACPTGAIHLGEGAYHDFSVLVVDDDPRVLEVLVEWLEDYGFQVETAGSGPEALERLGRDGFDLMILDIVMPGMGGLEVQEKVKELHPEIPVMVMTSHETVDLVVEAMMAGALDYVIKPTASDYFPIDPETLLLKVSRAYHNLKRLEKREVEVGSVILTAGVDFFDPAENPHFTAYGRLSNVVTSLEFERLMSGTGPTGGKILRPSDHKEVRSVAWLQCVGSRNVQLDADFCSSVCCMFAIKEALKAKEKVPGPVDTAIFYMDMRTFGKNFQRYRDSAEKEHRVRFVRSRVHSVEESAGSDGDLEITYVDPSGSSNTETFDMVVLSTGQRPSAGAETLAALTETKLNKWGFARTRPFSLSQTDRDGIFVGGSFSGFRDISESVIQASSASLAASRLIHSKGGGLAEETLDATEYRDVSSEPPSVLVTLCTCRGYLEKAADLEHLTSALGEMPYVNRVGLVESFCTSEGFEELRGIMENAGENRFIIGACMPHLYSGKLARLSRAVGISATLTEVVDIFTPTFPSRNSDREQVTSEIKAKLAIAAGKLKEVDPAKPLLLPVTQTALVVGGGIAGMSAALAIADHGFEVTLVEKGRELGGNLITLHRTLGGDSPQELLKETVTKVEKHPNIRVYKEAQVVSSKGRVGRLRTVIETEEEGQKTLTHGVTILATGGREAETESYSYSESEAIVTQHELEKRLNSEGFDPKSLSTVAMIQCVDSREEPRNYCSRICCASALKNALHIKELNPEADVYILARDIMSYGFNETYYTQARSQGVIFINYEVDEKPKVSVENGTVVLRAVDPILGMELVIKPDLLALSTGVVPGDQKIMANIFGVEVDPDGFFREAESKWRPVDFLREGIFTCGLAHSPRFIDETIAMAEAAAARALRILSSDRLTVSANTAYVRHSLCALCEQCVAACPYGARWLDEEEEMLIVDELACQGCGACAAVCPNSASVLAGYKNRQLFSMIEAAVQEAV